MRFFIVAIMAKLALCGSLKAQELSLSDTIRAEEVHVYAPHRRYQAGAKIEQINKEQIEASSSEGIDKLLMRFAPVYIKSDANGIAGIRLRGTAPYHTAINFGGINLNSLSLGSSNLSDIPVYLFDAVNLQYGSSSAINGTGAIGGALHLGLNTNWTNGMKINTRISEGSFGEQLYGTKVFWGNGKFEWASRMYYNTLTNNFPFRYNDKEYKQRNAGAERYGLLQEINYRFDPKQWIKTSIWLQSNFHEVAQTMSSHEVDATTNGTLDDDAIRLWSEYQNKKGKINYKVGVGYVNDKQVSDGNKEQLIITNRLVSEVEASQDISNNFGYKAGLKYQYIKPDVYAYPDSIINYENRADLYAMLFYSAWNKLKLTLNARQQFVSNYKAPFTPTLGAEYRLLLTNHSKLVLMGNVAHSYRIPTFNDRFWAKVGNPELKPEQGMNYEIGLQYVYCASHFQSTIQLNTFYMDVDNWIEWRPGATGLYTPENRTKVISKGIEFQMKNKLDINEWSFNCMLNFTINPTEVKEDALTRRVGKPLLYTPKSNANAYLSVNYKSWSMFVSSAYTGERLTDYSGSYLHPDGNTLEEYVLADGEIGKAFFIGKHNCKLALTCNNALNRSYMNQEGYAMPSRSFRFTFSSNLNFIK